MARSALKRLDLVSRVTIRIFIGQLVLAAIMAATGPKGFMPTFAAVLVIFAIVQTIQAAGVKQRPPASSLTEWDGVSWLLLVATGCHILAR